jgi:hypothetical protein
MSYDSGHDVDLEISGDLHADWVEAMEARAMEGGDMEAEAEGFHLVNAEWLHADLEAEDQTCHWENDFYVMS